MPIPVYHQMSDHDAEAIADYLLSLKPTRNALARSQYKIALPPSYGSTITHVDEPVTNDKVAYGSYLVSLGHCVRCHTPPGDGKPFNRTSPLRADANSHVSAKSRQASAAILRPIPSKVSASGATTKSGMRSPKVSEQTARKEINLGVKAAPPHCGAAFTPRFISLLAGPMPYDWYAKMTPSDLGAIVAFMRTIKPIRTQ
jgi:cytochrome c553